MKNKKRPAIQKWQAIQEKLGKGKSQIIPFAMLSQMQGGVGGDIYSTDSYSGGKPPPRK